MTSLVPLDPGDADLETLRARATEREALLEERAAAFDAASRALDLFAARYRQQVGTLHDELDRLELDIAEAELGELSRQVAEDGAPDPAPREPRPAAPPRFTSDAVRTLFRDVARAIHPDLARDDQARHRRHALMIEANRAYALRDEEQLRRILDTWANSPEAVQGTDETAIRLRLERRIAEIDAQLETCAKDLADLQASPLFELHTMVDDAAAKGRDLLEDMVRRLKRDIMAATNRLDAIRSTP